MQKSQIKMAEPKLRLAFCFPQLGGILHLSEVSQVDTHAAEILEGLGHFFDLFCRKESEGPSPTQHSSSLNGWRWPDVPKRSPDILERSGFAEYPSSGGSLSASRSGT